MAGERRALTDRDILLAAAALSLMTLKVTRGVHWQAFRLWIKGVPAVAGPARG